MGEGEGIPVSQSRDEETLPHTLAALHACF